jgi:DHA1 family bicyclomycin/chloramphenicol resistance-like MFS transporter
MNLLRWSHKQCLLKLFPLVITISFGMDVFVPAIPSMRVYFETTSNYMQATLYIFMWTVAIGQLFIGPLADKFGRHRLAHYTALLFLLGSIIASQAFSMSVLLVARVIQAIGACGTYLLCFIIIRDNFSTKDCGRLFSQLAGTNAIAASTAPIIGGILLDWTQNWRSGFYFLTGLGIIITFTAYRNIPNYTYQVSKISGGIFSRFRHILSNAHFRQYSLISANGMLGLYLFCALSPKILIGDLKLTGTAYGLWFGLNAMTAFMANFIAARLTMYRTLHQIVQYGLIIITFAASVMLIIDFFYTGVLYFMLPMLCLTIGIGMSMGCATALALKDFEAIAGTATSLVSAIQFGLAGLIGILVTFWTLGPMSLAIPMLILALFNLVKLILKQREQGYLS